MTCRSYKGNMEFCLCQDRSCKRPFSCSECLSSGYYVTETNCLIEANYLKRVRLLSRQSETSQTTKIQMDGVSMEYFELEKR